MSIKSLVTDQIVSLPKGGGALHGIGEKFSPDLQTGTGNFTVPIAVPAGRNGFEPHLDLTYSSGNGSGAFGLGWRIGVPGISRKTSKRVPLYDGSDTFVLSGVEDLVRIADVADGVSEYRPRTEGLFARIRHHEGPSDDYWVVEGKDGYVSTYGTPGGADVSRSSRSRDPACIVRPDDHRRVFAWNLTRTEDPFGNRIEYTYERDGVASQAGGRWDQLYLSQIRYGDFGADRAAPQFLMSVRFIYEDRPDAFSEYRAGFEIRTTRRCTRIDVFTHAVPNTLTRSYRFSYADQLGVAAATLPLNGASLLSEVRVDGHDGERSQSYPSLQFGYTSFEPDARTFFPLQGSDLPARSLADRDLELVDLFGNGLPCFLEMSGTVRYWRNLGNGEFDAPREMREAPPLQLSDPGVQLIDANGDGRTDLLVTNPTSAGYYSLRFGGMWDSQSFQPYAVAPSFDLKDPEVHLVDLDGDGVTDAVRSGTRFECFFNDPRAGWGATRWVERRAADEFPDVDFSDTRVKWADMTGDGLQDIVLLMNGNVEYWPNLGRGEWGSRVSMRTAPRFPYGYDPRRILVGDVDGDGAADIVYVDDTSVTLWINRSGNGWSEPIVIDGTPPVSDLDALRLVDLLGNGVSGVLWSADATGQSAANLFFLDFTGGIKPYLMATVDNRLGAVTRVQYAPSTRFYLEDEKAGTPWRTSLPFPVQAVSRVETVDEISDGTLTTEYHYAHGSWDGAEREYRGFGRVDHRDTETFDPRVHPDRSPPIETRTWFHLGPVGDEFGDWEEIDFRDEFWAGDPSRLTRPDSVVRFLQALPRRVARDAVRALRGTILRTEMRALDGMPRQELPYTVTEQLNGVVEIVDDGAPSRLASDVATDGDGQADDCPRIFFPHALGDRTTQWERGDEPSSQYTFIDGYDAFGRARQRTVIGCPRGWRDEDDVPGVPYLATRTVTTYATPDDRAVYIHDRVAQRTTYELQNTGTMALRELMATSALEVIGQDVHFYDGDAFVGLPSGRLGTRGALVRTESLVLTDAILDAAYGAGSRPPYVTAGAPPAWTAEYPSEFRGVVPPVAGYVHQAGGADSVYVAGYFAVTERRRYDVHDDALGGRGLVTVRRDALGRDTVSTYDRFNFFTATVTDAAGLVTTIEHDYRVMQPRSVTDPNGNATRFTFGPLGLLESTSIVGKAGEGDRVRASVRMEHDLLAFATSGGPISVRTIRHTEHDADADAALDSPITTVEYSDGFGRLLQTRTQADDVVFGDGTYGGSVVPRAQTEPGGDVVGRRVNDPQGAPRVTVSGWQIYDNKGRVIVTYEPFFSAGWTFAAPRDEQLGRKIVMSYDPRGRLLRTVDPDGSERLTVFGVPLDVARPDVFAPTPWVAFTYDANDNAGRTHPSDANARSFDHHWNTPSSIVVDALGRTVETIERHRRKNKDGTVTSLAELRTTSTYDLRGNVVALDDALGRRAVTYVYDLTNQRLRTDGIDAGSRHSVVDAAGDLIEQRDGKGALVLRVYDVLRRQVALWARDDTAADVTLRERLEYGDGGDPQQSAADRAAARTSNRLGRLSTCFDEAGRVDFVAYDFKGNAVSKARQVIRESVIVAAFDAPPPGWDVPTFRVDWRQPAAGLLDPTVYATDFVFDALNRIKATTLPQDVDGHRKTMRHTYTRSGALEAVALDGTATVERIAYDAKGQRTMVAYGNGVLTRYAYDENTFRLARLRSEYYDEAGLTYHPRGIVLQDLAYEYDLVGNITAIHDRTPGCGVPGTALGVDAHDRRFSYDSLYRLTGATGRECKAAPPMRPWEDAPKCTDPTLTRSYVEDYTYDDAGNLRRLAHAATDGTFSRDLAVTATDDRLQTLTVTSDSGASAIAYSYDPSGNVTAESTSRHFEWDHDDRLRAYRTQTSGAEPSVAAYHAYDSAAQRVQKVVRKQGGRIEVTVYVDDVFEEHRVGGASPERNNLIHVLDDRRRVAIVRVGAALDGDTSPATQVHLGDHLGSSALVLDSAGALVSREEYTPYGETTFGSFARKRYRFVGKERDETSGLYYCGARYYAPWLCRWISADPLGTVDGLNVFAHTRGNPIRYYDVQGTESTPPPTQADVHATSAEKTTSVPQLDLTPRSLQTVPENNPVTRLGLPPKAADASRLFGGGRERIESTVESVEGSNRAHDFPQPFSVGTSLRNIKSAIEANDFKARTGRRPTPLPQPPGIGKFDEKLPGETVVTATDIKDVYDFVTKRSLSRDLHRVQRRLEEGLTKGLTKVHQALEKADQALKEKWKQGKVGDVFGESRDAERRPAARGPQSPLQQKYDVFKANVEKWMKLHK